MADGFEAWSDWRRFDIPKLEVGPVCTTIDHIPYRHQFDSEIYQGNLENYEAAERIGRASANIKRENRRWFYEVFETYKGLRSDAGYMYDWDDLAYYAYHELLNDTDDRRYDHIIVDEGQDFSPMMIKTLTIAASKTGSFSFFWRCCSTNIRFSPFVEGLGYSSWRK